MRQSIRLMNFMARFDTMRAMTDEHQSQNQIVMYGSHWCAYTQRARRWMEQWQVPYRYVEVESTPGAEALIANWNEGRAVRPTIDIGGAVFINPDQTTLEAELRAQGFEI